jgi:hypothetical protein
LHIHHDKPHLDSTTVDDNVIPLLPAPWPPLLTAKLSASKWCVPSSCCTTPLPLREMAIACPITAVAARMWSSPDAPPPTTSNIIPEYNITCSDMALVYMSPNPYHNAFEEVVDIRRFDFNRHCTAGLCLAQVNGWLILGGMTPSTPAAKIPCWRSRIKGAWLIKIGNSTVSSIEEAQRAFQHLGSASVSSIPLLFSHPEIRQDISRDGLPIVSSASFTQHIHNQLNHRWDFFDRGRLLAQSTSI